MAFLDAEGGGDAGLFQDILEGAAVGNGRTLPFQALDGVVGDEVHLCANAAGVAGEDGRLGELVVDPLDQDVFKRELLLFRRVPMRQRIHQLGDGILLVHRHDAVADFVSGTVERDREADLLGMIRELPDLRGEAGGGDGEVARTEMQRFRAGDEGDGLHQAFEIRHRLAHTHEHKAVHALAGDLLRREHLPGDFRGIEVPRVTGKTGGAELAAVGTADL